MGLQHIKNCPWMPLSLDAIHPLPPSSVFDVADCFLLCNSAFRFLFRPLFRPPRVDGPCVHPLHDRFPPLVWYAVRFGIAQCVRNDTSCMLYALRVAQVRGHERVRRHQHHLRTRQDQRLHRSLMHGVLGARSIRTRDADTSMYLYIRRTCCDTGWWLMIGALLRMRSLGIWTLAAGIVSGSNYV